MGVSASMIMKEGLIFTGIKPIKKKEIDDLYSYESSMFKIQYENEIEEKKLMALPMDFFVK